MSSPEDGNTNGNDASSPYPPAGSSFDDQGDKHGPNPSIPAGHHRGIFQSGAVLESRFRIVRILGRGGMGEVYEAEDLVLKENVALKTLLPQIATDEHFRDRFRREVLLARKVTHPNVCRIFDVFGDAPVSSSGVGVKSVSVPFMTMELLHGKTLARFLVEENSSGTKSPTGESKKLLTPQEALPLVIQMAAALEAAHQVGVVHRDFKTSNVFLAERSNTTQRRVVVTDFGLARMSEADGAGGVSFTGQNEFVGTPIYMAPEQVEGGEITPATDIYALGIVLYEMVTGTWPFLGKTPRETANLRLKTSPAPPKSLVSSLDDKWNSVILRCLERDPVDRFRSVTEVVESLEGQSAALRRRTRAQRQRLGKVIQVVAAATFSVTIAFGTYHWWPRSITTGNQASVAVVRFQNLSQRPDRNWIGTSLEDTLALELAASDGLRVIPTADVARMRQELVPPGAGDLESASLEKIQTNLSVDDLILGDYELSGQPNDEQIRVTVRIVNPSREGEPLTLGMNGHESDIFGLTDAIARSVRAKLKVSDISMADRARLRAALPANNSASQAYFNGLEKLNQFDPLAAKDYLAEAVQKDPDSPLPHFALSQDWDLLGYDKNALDEARRALKASKNLSNPEQRAIECRVLELERSNWDDAIKACRGVWMFRKRLDDGLRLAAVQFSAERWKDALETLMSLRKDLPAPENSDPRIDISEARTRAALTQYSGMQSAADTARAKAEKQGAPLLQAQALLWTCVAQQNLDNLPDAKKSCNRADDLFSTVGDKIGQARSVTSLAHILAKSNDLKIAESKYEEALELAKSVGSMRDRCDALLNYGGVLYERNELDAAVPKFQESLEIAAESGNLGCRAKAVEILGLIDKDRREFSQSIKKLDQAQKLYSDLNMSADLARLNSNLGDLLWQQGDPVGARVDLEDSARRQRELGLRGGLYFTLVTLGDVRLAQNELDAALAAYKEARDIKREVHQDDDATLMEIYIAQTLIETGNAGEAERSARTLVAWCSSKHDEDNAAFAMDVLIQSLLAQEGKFPDAVSEAKTLQALLPKTSEPETILSARVTIARAFATMDTFPRALADLRAIAAQARKGSFVMQELSANLALAESERLHGIYPNNSSLETLVQTAKNKGYLLLARKASALLVAPRVL